MRKYIPPPHHPFPFAKSKGDNPDKRKRKQKHKMSKIIVEYAVHSYFSRIECHWFIKRF
jgi:hypothetical protein